MKALSLLLIVFLIGCQVVETEVESTNIELTQEEVTKKTYDYDVRLLSQGFDVDELNIRQGEAVTIIISDNDVNGHYLLLNEQRITDRKLMKGDQFTQGFNEQGEFMITDETSKASVKVIVE